MKEEKDHRPKEKLVTLLMPQGATGSSAGAAAEGAKGDDKQDRNRDKKEALSKVVIRRLPPTLTMEQLQEHLQPMPEHDYFEFFSNDTSLDRFDGYVFLDNKGQEYHAIVEFAPFQKAAKKKIKKRDTKVGTIDDDPEYRKFLESYATDEKMTSTPETLLEEIEAKNRDLIAKRTTPLLSFLKNKQRMREEKREERRRREIERKRQREEERRKWKEEEKRKRKDIEKLKKIERIPEREKIKDEPKIKRSDVELKDEKLKRADDECVRDYRDRDRDYERDQERMIRERERLKRQEEERRRQLQKERYEKEKAFKRREEEMKREKEALRDKGKKTENIESIRTSEDGKERRD
ncbi:regulator of nonsense transcripts 3B isoform X2 [Sigmodon hispidus]